MVKVKLSVLLQCCRRESFVSSTLQYVKEQLIGLN